MSEKDKLEREEEETLSKLLRLRKQKRALEERVRKAVSRDLRDISELEKEESTRPPSDPSFPPSDLPHLPTSDPSAVDPLPGFDWSLGPSFDLSPVGGPSFLAGPDSSGGTPPVSQDNGGS